MKTFAARLSVVVLAITGFAASTVVSYAAPKKHEAKTVMCIPTNPHCPPGDPNGCGID